MHTHTDTMTYAGSNSYLTWISLFLHFYLTTTIYLEQCPLLHQPATMPLLRLHSTVRVQDSDVSVHAMLKKLYTTGQHNIYDQRCLSYKLACTTVVRHTGGAF